MVNGNIKELISNLHSKSLVVGLKLTTLEKEIKEMKSKGMNTLNNYFANYFAEKEQKDLQAIKDYCEEDGYVEDFENIFLPLYKKYGWDLIRDIGEIQWERVLGVQDIQYRVVYLNLDRLSTLVEWNEKKNKFVAI